MRNRKSYQNINCFFFFSHKNFPKVTSCVTKAQMLAGRIFLDSPNKN